MMGLLVFKKTKLMGAISTLTNKEIKPNYLLCVTDRLIPYSTITHSTITGVALWENSQLFF
jgi:hypothetical protein